MGKYDDILHREHPVSKKHPQMSTYDRAAQFAPFAALTGHGQAVEEIAQRKRLQVEQEEVGELIEGL